MANLCKIEVIFIQKFKKFSNTPKSRKYRSFHPFILFVLEFSKICEIFSNKSDFIEEIDCRWLLTSIHLPSWGFEVGV